MAAPVTPEEWLPILTQRLDDGRSRIDLLRSYSNGNAPLPEGGRNVRASWRAFQRKARSNFGELIVEAPAERIICSSLTVAGSDSDDDEARRIWRENRMDIALPDTIRDMLTVGVGYMVLGSEAGRPVITSEKPEYMYAATDPLRPWIARAAVKVWRDIDEGMDYAYVWANGEKQKFSRVSFDKGNRKKFLKIASGQWDVVGEPDRYTGKVPVYVFPNHDDTGEFEAHTDIIDRINKDILDRLVTTAMQAFRQRAAEGTLPPNDEAGNPIDYAAIFEPAPGALWNLPEGVKLWESQDSSQGIIAMLNAAKDDLRDLAAVTRTPLPMLVPEGQNQSAAGAESAKEGLVMKTKDRIARIGPPAGELMTDAMKVAVSDFADRVDVSFFDPTYITVSERYAAAVEAKNADVPWRTRMIDILGFSADKVDGMQTELEEERLAAQLALPPEPTPQANASAAA